MPSPIAHTDAWIFVSDSHRDLEKVREIRNYLEKKGASPLLFFLKCLSDDDARLPELITDEIKARNFFVLCDSPNAKASKYVPEEVTLVESLGKPRETIDLSSPLEPQFHKLDRLLKRATVFLSYAHADASVAMRIQEALVKHDYRVWSDEDLLPGSDWASATRTAFDEAAKHGFVLLLMSASLLKSKHCHREIEHAMNMRGNIVPIAIERLDISEYPPSLQYISYLTCFDLTTGPFDDRVEELIRNLKTREMEYHYEQHLFRDYAFQ